MDARRRRMARLGIDLDGVMYPFQEVFRKWVEWKHLTTPVPECPPKWYFYREWGIPDDRFVKMMEEGCLDGWVFWKGLPEKDSVTTVQRLKSEGHKIVILTTRGNYAKPATKSWLEYWQIPYDELYLTADKTGYGIDALVDDRHKNIDAALSEGVRALMYTRPWNEEYTGYERVNTWRELGLKLGLT